MEKVLYGKWTIEEGDRWELKGREIKKKYRTQTQQHSWFRQRVY